MPREGYKQITVPEDLKEDLLKEAQARDVSVPVLLKQFLASGDGTPTGDTEHIGWISPRVAGVVLRASNVFNKPPKEALEKLIDTPAQVLLDMPTSKTPTNDLIKEGLGLIRDLDPDQAQNLEVTLKEISKGNQ